MSYRGGSAAAPYFYQGPANFGQGINQAATGFLSQLEAAERERKEREREQLAREDRARTITWAAEDRARAQADRAKDSESAQAMVRIAGFDPGKLGLPAEGFTMAQAATAISLAKDQASRAKEEGKGAAVADLLRGERKTLEGMTGRRPTGFMEAVEASLPPRAGAGFLDGMTPSSPAADPALAGIRPTPPDALANWRADSAALPKVDAHNERVGNFAALAKAGYPELALSRYDTSLTQTTTAEDRAQKTDEYNWNKSRRGVIEQQDELALRAAGDALETSALSREVVQETLEKLRREAKESAGKKQVFYRLDEIKDGQVGPPLRYDLTETNIPVGLVDQAMAIQVMQNQLTAAKANAKDGPQSGTDAYKKAVEMMTKFGRPLEEAIRTAYGIKDESFVMAWRAATGTAQATGYSPGDAEYDKAFDRAFEDARRRLNPTAPSATSGIRRVELDAAGNLIEVAPSPAGPAGAPAPATPGTAPAPAPVQVAPSAAAPPPAPAPAQVTPTPSPVAASPVAAPAPESPRYLDRLGAEGVGPPRSMGPRPEFAPWNLMSSMRSLPTGDQLQRERPSGNAGAPVQSAQMIKGTLEAIALAGVPEQALPAVFEALQQSGRPATVANLQAAYRALYVRPAPSWLGEGRTRAP